MSATARSILVAVTLALAAPTGRGQQSLPAPTPVVPPGVEVLARGPVHEAFATPSTDPQPPLLIPRKPPPPLPEMPPDERPEGDVIWVPGYFAWDDERQDFLWVSGCWRVTPAGMQWVAGYWRQVGQQWQRVPGFWTPVQASQPSYYPAPPAAPQVADPGPAPAPNMFYAPGYWSLLGDRYAWRAGSWTAVRPGYVYVPSQCRWTANGYVFVPAYWDLAVSQRGLLYAPVLVDLAVVDARFVYTPGYAVTDMLLLDSLFVRPSFGQYYFGDYYGPRYRGLGFEASVVYGRRGYEPIVAYQRWQYRTNPGWLDGQINLYNDRCAGRAAVPPRTLIEQTAVVNSNVGNVTNVTRMNVSRAQVLAPTSTILAARGQHTLPHRNVAPAQAHKGAQPVNSLHHALTPHIVHGAPAARPTPAVVSPSLKTSPQHTPAVPTQAVPSVHAPRSAPPPHRPMAATSAVSAPAVHTAAPRSVAAATSHSSPPTQRHVPAAAPAVTPAQPVMPAQSAHVRPSKSAPAEHHKAKAAKAGAT